MKKILLLFLSALPVLTFSQPIPEGGTSIFVNIDAAHDQWQISPYINGSHFVYAFENDRLYQDEKIAGWMKNSGVKVIRWPGGTAVQSYHWDKLNGIPFKSDTWDPAYNQTAKEPANFMDVDEFVAYCRKVGAEPMVGINIRSGKMYNREEDGLAEAKRLIEHCKAKGYKVKFWYIGNEGYASGFGMNTYPEYIDKYANVLKSVDPNITIIGDWKMGPIIKNRFNESIEIIKKSNQIDVMEYHEKWGTPWGLVSGQNFDDWETEFPLYNGRLTNYIQRFRLEMELMGKSNVQLAMNEWGLGNIKGATPFENALVASDYLIEMYRNNVFMACYWNLNLGDKNSKVIITKDNGTKLDYFNPVASVFELLGMAPGKLFLNVDCTHKEVYGFATLDKQTGNISVFLLNKSATDNEIELAIRNSKSTFSNIAISSLVAPGEIHTSKVKADKFKDGMKIRLPSFSFNRIEINSK